MNRDLIDRYVYAVTRRMDRGLREDVTKELHCLIEDMLAEQCGERAPTEKDVRVVLTELGSPRELQGKYEENGEKCLIGQPYYTTYLFVLKIVLACVALGMTVVTGIHIVTEGQRWYEALLSWLSLLWNGGLSAFAIVTLLFAVFYRKEIRITEDYNFDDLPPVPRKNQEISRWGCGFEIGFFLVFLLVFLLAPQVFCAILTETKETIPIFDSQVIRSTWYILTAFCVAGIVRDAVKLVERRYNRRVMATTLIADGLSAGLAVWWLTRPGLINPEFTEFLAELFAGENAMAGKLLGNFQYFFLGVILFALLLDACEAVWKTWKG